MNEEKHETNWGLFPRLNDGREENANSGIYETSPQLLKSVDGFCRDQGVDMALLFQLAWSVVLRRYAETDCVCIGIGNLGSLYMPVDGFQRRQWLLAPKASTRALLRDPQHGQICVSSKDPTTRHNTAVLMMRDEATGNDIQWLARVLDNERVCGLHTCFGLAKEPKRRITRIITKCSFSSTWTLTHYQSGCVFSTTAVYSMVGRRAMLHAP